MRTISVQNVALRLVANIFKKIKYGRLFNYQVKRRFGIEQAHAKCLS